MNQRQIKEFIQTRKSELVDLRLFWSNFLQWSVLLELSEETKDDVEIKYNNRYVMLQMSIQDHEKLLK